MKKMALSFLWLLIAIMAVSSVLQLWRGFVEGAFWTLLFASLINLLRAHLTRRAGGRLKLMRVYDESEVEEVSVGEYRLKNRRR